MLFVQRAKSFAVSIGNPPDEMRLPTRLNHSINSSSKLCNSTSKASNGSRGELDAHLRLSGPGHSSGAYHLRCCKRAKPYTRELHSLG